eukprot:gene111-16333_t
MRRDVLGLAARAPPLLSLPVRGSESVAPSGTITFTRQRIIPGAMSYAVARFAITRAGRGGAGRGAGKAAGRRGTKKWAAAKKVRAEHPAGTPRQVLLQTKYCNTVLGEGVLDTSNAFRQRGLE